MLYYLNITSARSPSIVSARFTSYNTCMNGPNLLSIYGSVLATIAFVWNIWNTIRNRPGIKLSNLSLIEWAGQDPKIEFRAVNHKQEPIKIECYGLTLQGGQTFAAYAPPPENEMVPARDYRKFTIPIKHIKELYRPEIRSAFRFIFVKDTTGGIYRMRLTKNMVREIMA